MLPVRGKVAWGGVRVYLCSGHPGTQGWDALVCGIAATGLQGLLSRRTWGSGCGWQSTQGT